MFVPKPPTTSLSPLTSILFYTGLTFLFLNHSYISTDFYVHRNWLSITSNLPITSWYFDEVDDTNTPDYPPLFMFFEYGLSKVMKVLPVDSKCSEVLSFPDAVYVTSLGEKQLRSIVATMCRSLRNSHASPSS